MIPKETRKLNKFYQNFQKNFTQGWKAGIPTFILVMLVFLMLVYFLFKALGQF